MKWLTKQEINIALAVIFLFIVGLAVKTWRTANAGDTTTLVEERR
jgi:hypothetical protein